MVPRFYVERGGAFANGSHVIDRSTSASVAHCYEHTQAEIIASMFNNRVRFKEPLHAPSTRDREAQPV